MTTWILARRAAEARRVYDVMTDEDRPPVAAVSEEAEHPYPLFAYGASAGELYSPNNHLTSAFTHDNTLDALGYQPCPLRFDLLGDWGRRDGEARCARAATMDEDGPPAAAVSEEAEHPYPLFAYGASAGELYSPNNHPTLTIDCGDAFDNASGDRRWGDVLMSEDWPPAAAVLEDDDTYPTFATAREFVSSDNNLPSIILTPASGVRQGHWHNFTVSTFCDDIIIAYDETETPPNGSVLAITV